MATHPKILVIDDQPDSVGYQIRQLTPGLQSGVTIAHPDEIDEGSIKRSQLVLVDFKLPEWRGNVTSDRVCQHVPNGIALAAILQQRATEFGRPIAFAIHSDHLRELTDPYPPEPRVHLIARTYNLEWAFAKSPADGGVERTFHQAQILAKAVAVLPSAWSNDKPEATRKKAQKLLGLDTKKKWSEQAWRDVEMARPPLDELTTQIHGLLFLRWLLTRVISYPCFLMQEPWIAARLGIKYESLNAGFQHGLKRFLEPARYLGILQDFQGPRWWRTGVEMLLWELAGSRTIPTSQLQEIISKKLKVQLEPVSFSEPIVGLDENYRPLNQFMASSEAVRLQIDDWPAHAETAWTTLTLAKSDRFRGLVIDADRSRLVDS